MEIENKTLPLSAVSMKGMEKGHVGCLSSTRIQTASIG